MSYPLLETLQSETVEARIVEISPALSQHLLRRNGRNRPYSDRYAQSLAAAMKRGEWKLNGDAIRFSRSGVLLDGQHRLSAIFKAGRSVLVNLVTGLDEEAFDTIDVNRRGRSAGDVLAIKGYKNYRNLAAVALLLHKYRISGNPTHGNPDLNPSTAQICALAEQDALLVTAAGEAAGMRWASKYLTPALTGFCMRVFLEDDPAAASTFFEQLESGVGLTFGSPVLLLRDRLMLAKSDKQRQLSKYYKLALVFKAYKALKTGRPVKTLRVRLDGDAPERDPFKLGGRRDAR